MKKTLIAALLITPMAAGMRYSLTDTRRHD